MNRRFGIVKGANRWRVVEATGAVRVGAEDFGEYRYASEPLDTKREALALLQRLAGVTRARVVNPLEDE